MDHSSLSLAQKATQLKAITGQLCGQSGLRAAALAQYTALQQTSNNAPPISRRAKKLIRASLIGTVSFEKTNWKLAARTVFVHQTVAERHLKELSRKRPEKCSPRIMPSQFRGVIMESGAYVARLSRRSVIR